MQRIPILLLFLVFTAILLPLSPTHAKKASPRRIPKTRPPSKHKRGKYLVKFKAEAKIARIASFFTQKAVQKGHKASIKSIANAKGENVGGALDELKGAFDTLITDVYHELQRFTDKVFHGLALRMSDDTLNEFKRKFKDLIMYVEKNGRLYASDIVDKQPASWGLARVSAKQAIEVNGDNTSPAPFQAPGKDGQGVDVYVLDTGVDASNPDFEGRAQMLKSFVEGEGDKDEEGHGTHCAGTITSKTYGIARKCKVYGVKVLGKDGSGDFATIISAIDYVVQRAKPNKSIINMSLGGDVSQAVSDAVQAAVDAGILVVVAAGNESADACQSSPASSEAALSVGAINTKDELADFSNYGKCVKILAPGTDIVSLGINGKDTSTQSGTSMAAPHVVGVAAVYMSNKDYKSIKEVVADLKAGAIKNVAKDTKDSANLVVYLGGSPKAKGGKEAAAPAESGGSSEPSGDAADKPVESGDGGADTPPQGGDAAQSDDDKLLGTTDSETPVFQSLLQGIITSFGKANPFSTMSAKSKAVKSDEDRLLETPPTEEEVKAQDEDKLLKSI